LGLVAVVIAVTFKCVPLFRVTEVTYLSSIREKKKWRRIFYGSLTFGFRIRNICFLSDPDPALF
jgi:hypothetical protein